MSKATWRVDFFENTDDATPVRFTIIEASSEEQAAEIAAESMRSSEMRADVTRTIRRQN